MSGERRTLSQELRRLVPLCQGDLFSVGTLVQAMGDRGHPLFILFFSLPFLLPIPLPGLSLLFGILIAASGVGVMLGWPLWLPSFLSRRELPGPLIAKFLEHSARLAERFEHVLKPRGLRWSDHAITRVLVGLMIMVSAFILALPLPPGTNFPPAATCALLALGLLEKDGLALIVGSVTFTAKVTAFFLLSSTLYAWASDWWA